jgi:very-short-patch-repair endonuclease
VLAAVEQRDSEIRAHFGAPANHPWRGVRNGELTIFERQALITAFEACRTAAQVVVDVLDHLGGICGAALDELSPTACSAIAGAIGALPDADLEIDDAVFARLGDPTALEAVVMLNESLTQRDGARTPDPVIDEASQMRPEDALGALARARQVVIVGDPKQLPPTSFFDRLDEPADEEDESADPESILGLALNTFRPARRLRWHYRSRHGSLIAFSNRRFYDDDLIVFPSPRELGGGFGVEYQRIVGTYEGRSNVVEAQAVADAALAFMREHFDLSLGIVAINKTQAELIAHEIDRLVARDRAAADYVQYWEGRLESFFVKNLETVQGDERDVIMISTVYGPDRNGVVHQRFGPINGELGWRRLNVLFTRAKNRLILFSSMDPNDIRLGPETRRGVREFRAYLEYAATGRLEVGDISSREPDSDFEIWVRERLSDHGYEVVPQVGVAGYFIDLAVRHPRNPNGFLLGIECDGASYHRAKSVRDRDRLRQEVLERLGWQLYRVWSTDWFNDPARAFKKLVVHIEGLASRPDLRGSHQVIRLAHGRSEETSGPSGERANEPSRHQGEFRRPLPARP